MSVYVWNDVSPDDGCTLVRFRMEATSLHEVVAAIRGVAGLRNTTISHLLKRGKARKARPNEAEAALVHPGVVLWLDHDMENWRVLAQRA